MRPFDELMALFKRATNIKVTLGMRSAAGYLRNRNIDFQAAHLALLGVAPRY